MTKPTAGACAWITRLFLVSFFSSRRQRKMRLRCLTMAPATSHISRIDQAFIRTPTVERAESITRPIFCSLR